MNQYIKSLGKVCITPAGRHSQDKEYERLDLVYHLESNSTYISKTCVPKGIEITNEEYWQIVISGANVVGGDIEDMDIIEQIKKLNDRITELELKVAAIAPPDGYDYVLVKSIDN